MIHTVFKPTALFFAALSFRSRIYRRTASGVTPIRRAASCTVTPLVILAPRPNLAISLKSHPGCNLHGTILDS